MGSVNLEFSLQLDVRKGKKKNCVEVLCCFTFSDFQLRIFNLIIYSVVVCNYDDSIC